MLKSISPMNTLNTTNPMNTINTRFSEYTATFVPFFWGKGCILKREKNQEITGRYECSVFI
jgi:hypothetical protein